MLPKRRIDGRAPEAPAENALFPPIALTQAARSSLRTFSKY
jgi:hypothetical protein